MWQIAERADPQAATDFVERFPALRDDLQTRMQIVSGLKQTRQAITPAFLPQFSPRFMYRPKPKWLRLAPGALGLAALAAASFYVTQNLLTPLPETWHAEPTKPRLRGPITTFKPPPANLPFDSTEGPRPYSGEKSFGERIPAFAAPPIHIAMKDVPLKTIIGSIASQNGLTLNYAPGFPNPIVSVDLSGSDGLELLTKLGQEHSFTAFHEGNKHVLLIPAVEGGGATNP
ncbi:MAG: hypothetical protein QOJ65_2061 [Fimbriimonadaceae bacterium]|jgi:hypothetical protein|nr:hypothetical protein [Fimbriimonadaceae bacterium]